MNWLWIPFFQFLFSRYEDLDKLGNRRLYPPVEVRKVSEGANKMTTTVTVGSYQDTVHRELMPMVHKLEEMVPTGNDELLAMVNKLKSDLFTTVIANKLVTKADYFDAQGAILKVGTYCRHHHLWGMSVHIWRMVTRLLKISQQYGDKQMNLFGEDER